MDIKEYISKSIETKNKILKNEAIISTVKKIADVIVEAYKNDRKVLTAGNGGSAGDAQHIVGELISKVFMERPALSAIALTTDSSVLTAVSNDFSYEEVFVRQIQANAKAGDVFIAISTSGNSKNIINALEVAKTKDVVTVGLTGEKECKMDGLCDYIIHVPSEVTPIIQESHIMLSHIICAKVEEAIFGNKG